MYIEEIADACSFDPAEGALLAERLKPANVYELLDDVVTIQPPLTAQKEILKPRYHTIILAHASVGEFLLNTLLASQPVFPEKAKIFQLLGSTANELIAQSCLTYLFKYNSYEERRENYPLRIYAWYNWDKHILIKDDDQCPVRDSFVVRRRARQLYGALSTIIATGKNVSYLVRDEAWKELIAMKKAISCLADSLTNSEVLWRLREALNVPFFNDKFDIMFPSGYPRGNISDMFIHKELDLSQRTPFRVLEILPCLDDSTTINGAIVHKTIQDASRYVALSYEWGRPALEDAATDSKSIRFYPEMTVNGLAATDLRPNLLRILRLLRSSTDENQPAIWIDAICIDQQNNLEKAHQVSIIGEIFANATDVIVGLNDFAGTADDGVECLNRIAAAASTISNQKCEEERIMAEMFTSLASPSAWDALFDLFHDTWWLRTWIVQEVVLASNAIFLVGSASFSFKAVESLARVEPLLRRMLPASSYQVLHRFNHDPGWTAAKNILQTRLECSQPTRPALPVLFWRFRHHRCALKQEKIYALLAICDPQKAPPYHLVNYRLRASEVYEDFFRWYIDEYHKLDILSICIPAQQDSWLRFYVNNLVEDPSWYQHLFSNAANECRPLILGTFDGSRAMDLYSAGGDGTVASVVDELPGISLLGASFDTVDEIVHITGEDGKVSKGILQHARDHFMQFTIEAFWRTLLADQWPSGERLPRVVNFKGARLPPISGDDQTRLLSVLNPEYDVPFLTGRSLAITTGRRVGLVPSRAEPGDELVIMPGGAVPLVLRNTERDMFSVTIERCRYYELIGER